MSKKSKRTFFNTKWLEDDEFKPWLAQSKKQNEARCKVCKKDFDLSNMGRQAVVSHAAGKKHKECNIKISSFFKPPTSSKEVINIDSVEEINQTSKSQTILEVVMSNSDKFKAEILWIVKSIMSGYSNNSSQDINLLFRKMFPDSKIASSFQVGADKVRYMTNYGIAPYFKSLLVDSLKMSDCYVVSFDESLNDMTQSCEMDLLLRYFDKLDNKVKTRYYDSQFLGHGTHKDLKTHFDNVLKDLNENKIFQISMDGPNVNLKFLETVQSERAQNEQHQLIDIGSCGLHTIHGAFKTGAEKN